MNIDDYKNIVSADEAREFAIDYQNWQTTQNLSWSEVSEWEEVFETLAEQFDLQEEFAENGLISFSERQLTDEELERQDFVDHAIFQMLREVLGKDIEWDISPIGDIRDIIIAHYVNDEEEMKFYPYKENK